MSLLFRRIGFPRFRVRPETKSHHNRCKGHAEDGVKEDSLCEFPPGGIKHKCKNDCGNDRKN
jgi:hypothetical protein